MGEIADMMIDGTLDHFDGSYIDGDSPGYPRFVDYRGIARPVYGGRKQYNNMTPAERKIESVRKELGALIKQRIKEGPGTEADNNRIVNECRAEINAKYGKGWRERGLHANGQCDNKSNVGTRNQWTEEELAPFQNKHKNKKNK